jgi:hypothetical protein
MISGPGEYSCGMGVRRARVKSCFMVLLIAIAALVSIVAAASLMVQRSVSSAGPSALRPDGRYERLQRHFMFGRGSMSLMNMNVYKFGPGIDFTTPGEERGTVVLAWAMHPGSFRTAWLRPWCYQGAGGRCVSIPLVSPALAMWGLLGVLLWRHLRRPRPGHCRCGYLLAGLPAAAPCPECGRRMVTGARG